MLLFRPIDDRTDVLHLQSDVNLILDWIKSNGLTPNHSKTQLLPITRSKRPLPFQISVDNHVVYPSKSVKYLGVTISHNLTWSEHIRLTCKSAKRNLGLIRHQFNHAPSSVHHKIYNSVILPKLEYCAAVWDPYFATNKSSLENVQKFAGKIITNQWNSSYSDIRTALNWQTLETSTYS